MDYGEQEIRYLFALLAGLASLASTPALADRLVFDHSLYPALQEAFRDQERNVRYVVSDNPRYIFDRIKVRGRSLDDFTEALEIMVTSRGRDVQTIADWFERYRQEQDETCGSEWQTLAQDAASITFSRTTRGCPEYDGQTRIYRTVLGERSVYMLTAITRGEMAQPLRETWLTVLASARLAN